MPNILALDCSTANCSVALATTDSEDLNDIGADSKELAAERKRSHHRLILPMIERLLKQAKIPQAELHSIICNVGPGSFMGLRIAVGVAQGISYANSLKLSGISSLEVLAMQMFEAWRRDANNKQAGGDKGGDEAGKKVGAQIGVVSLCDSKAGESYWAYYTGGQGDANNLGNNVRDLKLTEVIAPQLSKLSDITKQIPKEDALLITGIGSAMTQENISFIADSIKDSHQVLATQVTKKTSAKYLIKSARAKLATDSLDVLDPAELKPLYIREFIS